MVNIEKKQCSCGEFVEYWAACSQMLSIIKSEKLELFIEGNYSIHAYWSLYEELLHPLSISKSQTKPRYRYTYFSSSEGPTLIREILKWAMDDQGTVMWEV